MSLSTTLQSVYLEVPIAIVLGAAVMALLAHATEGSDTGTILRKVGIHLWKVSDRPLRAHILIAHDGASFADGVRLRTCTEKLGKVVASVGAILACEPGTMVTIWRIEIGSSGTARDNAAPILD